MIRKRHALFLLHADGDNLVAAGSTVLAIQREHLALETSSAIR